MDKLTNLLKRDNVRGICGEFINDLETDIMKLKTELSRNGIKMDNFDPVSYTHLDVYKRQELAKITRDGIEKEGLQFDIIYASPLSRARKTAEIVRGTQDVYKRQVWPWPD